MKRILALAIAIVMVMVLVPSLAFAEGEITVNDQAALKNALADVSVSTITLGADITLDSNTTLTINRDLTLDLGGHTLASSPVHYEVNTTGKLPVIVLEISGGNVTVKNGTIRGGDSRNCKSGSTSVCAVNIKYVATTVLFQGVKVYGSKTINSRNGGSGIETGGNLTLESCEVYSGDSIKDAALYVEGVSYGNKTGAGTAIKATGGNLTIKDSLVKGGDGITYGSNELYPTWNSEILGSGYNIACGGYAINDSAQGKTLTIANSTILGGDSNAYNAGHAINKTPNAVITDSTIRGGNSYGIFDLNAECGKGGNAIADFTSCPTTVTLTDSIIKGGDAGDSSDGIGYGLVYNSSEIKTVINGCFIGGGDISIGCYGYNQGNAIYASSYPVDKLVAGFSISDSVLQANEKAVDSGVLIYCQAEAAAAVQQILGENNPTTLYCRIGNPKAEHIAMVPGLQAAYIEELEAAIEADPTKASEKVEELAACSDEAQLALLGEGDTLDKLEQAVYHETEQPRLIIIGDEAESVKRVVGVALTTKNTSYLDVNIVTGYTPAAIPPVVAEDTKLVPLSIKLYDSAERTNEIPLKLPVKITMKIPQGLNNANKIAILHIDDAGNYKGIIYPTINTADNTMTFVAPSFSTFTVVNVDERRTDVSLVKMGVDPSYVVVIPSTVEFGTLTHHDTEDAIKTGFSVKVEQAFIAKTATITVTAASDYAMENNGDEITYQLFKNAESATVIGANATIVNAEAPMFATFGYEGDVTQINTETFDATVWGYLSCARNQIKYAGTYSDVMTFTITYNP